MKFYCAIVRVRYAGNLSGCPYFFVRKRRYVMKRKLLIVLLAVISVAACVFGLSGCGNKLSKVKLGDTQEQVQKIMGEPYRGESSSNSSWRYYGKNYLNLLNKIEKNS